MRRRSWSLSGEVGQEAVKPALAVGSRVRPCPFGLGVPSGPSASVILHVHASALILEVSGLFASDLTENF